MGNLFMKRIFALFSLLCSLLFLTGCETNSMIVSDLDEREANEIVVFLASKGINAQKTSTVSAAPGAAGTSTYGITVEGSKATDAMAILNRNGLPRKKTTTLLDLFAKSGLMTSDKEETIRYQAGLATQIANMILKIDGVIDADVQLSFPEETTSVPLPGQAQAAPKKITAAVYVKHQGILDDPNSHLVTKIKRLVAGSVNGLDINDVTVISDLSRFTDVSVAPQLEANQPAEKEYVSIWSIVMSKSSAGKFRALFIFLVVCAIVFAFLVGWMIWKFYPILKNRGGFRALLQPKPLENHETPPESPRKPPES